MTTYNADKRFSAENATQAESIRDLIEEIRADAREREARMEKRSAETEARMEKRSAETEARMKKTLDGLKADMDELKAEMKATQREVRTTSLTLSIGIAAMFVAMIFGVLNLIN